MKVLVMGSNNKYGGGLIIHYITLVQYLHKAGYEIACINVNDTGEKLLLPNSVKQINIAFKPLSVIDKIKKFIQLNKVVRFANSFDPNIFIATALGNGYAKVASKLPSYTFKIFQEVHFEAIADPLRLKMVHIFDAVAPQTPGMAKVFKENVSSKKPVVYLPCFSKEFNIENYKPVPDTTQEIRHAYFGRLAWNKGLKQYIAATADVFKTDGNLFLDIYGKGPELSIIKQEIQKHNLQNRIVLKGLYKDDDFPELISSYHGIVVPSIDTEGLPLILIEAMRFGRPVLCTTVGAMAEVGKINNKGMIISDKNPDELAKNLRLFIQAIRQKQFNAKHIYTIYEKHFSNDAFLRVWTNMLQDAKQYFKEAKQQ